jgi:hypothetical protein
VVKHEEASGLVGDRLKVEDLGVRHRLVEGVIHDDGAGDRAPDAFAGGLRVAGGRLVLDSGQGRLSMEEEPAGSCEKVPRCSGGDERVGGAGEKCGSCATWVDLAALETLRKVGPS